MMRNLFLVGMIALVALGACGRKEPPQPDANKALRIVGLEQEKAVSVLHLTFAILGGSGHVGYQIDRAEVDPICNCMTHWQRTFEQEPLPRQKGKVLTRNLKLLSHNRAFAFRIRAFDSLGNLSPWIETMRARADDITK